VIGQVQKFTEEILEMLDGKEKLVLYGCGGCATVFHTGGEP
jgi:flagellar biosynthesis/type III secretory pathway chaperone